MELPLLACSSAMPALLLYSPPLAGMMIEALHGLHTALLAGRGASGPGGAAVLPPPVQRAVQRGEAVAEALQLLAQVFDAERFNDGAADIALEPVSGWLQP